MLIGILYLVLLQQAPRPVAAVAQVPIRPPVEGKPYAEAESLLRRLRITVVPRDSNAPGVARGIVLRQIPAARTRVLPGSVDTLILAAGRRHDDVHVEVPDVIGLSYREAVRRVRARELAPVGPEMSPEDSAQGRVRNQEPRYPGPALPGSRVVLDVPIHLHTTVPAVVGLDSGVARRVLRDAHLTAAPSLAWDDRAPPGTVVHQDPAPQQPAEPGQRVRIEVSRGPHPDTTALLMPNLIGLRPDDAAATIKRSRLRFEHVDTVLNADGSGRVAAQHPEARDTVHLGDAVRIVVTMPLKTAFVPGLIGHPRAEAEDTLRKLGFEASPIRIVEVKSGKPGVVLQQSELPGKSLPLGSPVGLDISTRPETVYVVVPALVGLQIDEATRRLIDSSFNSLPIKRRSGPTDVVLEQSPEAGTRQPRGSAISMIVGLRGDDTVNVTPPEPPRYLVPSVTDSAVTAALRVLRGAGFVNVEVDSTAVTGIALGWKIAGQAPPAGQRVVAATLVRLAAAAIPGVQVPNVLERDSLQAALALADAGLVMRIAGSTMGLRLRGTIVRTQTPGSGQVAPQSPIVVTLTTPIPFILLSGIGLAGAAGAAALIGKVWPRPIVKPSIEVTLASDPPILEAPIEGIAGDGVSWRVEVILEPPALIAPDGLISEEKS